MKVGDIVVMQKDGQETLDGTDLFWHKGDKAVLYYQDHTGDWWADFTINDKYFGEGEWCIGCDKREFELYKPDSKAKEVMLWFERLSIFVAIWTIVFSLIRFVFELPPDYAWGYVAIAIFGFCMYPFKTWIDGVVK